MGRQRKMNENIFVDTSAWIALIDHSDTLYEQAKKVMDQLGKEKAILVTTEFIFMEVANALSRQPFRRYVITFINGLRNLKSVNIIPASADHLHKGWLLYCDRSDKEWSLTDCISFAIMINQNIAKSFTSDHHFEQAGFVNLM